ncbi:MAG: hypothetical protein ACRDGK_01945 [Actinomycetota bacterium]
MDTPTFIVRRRPPRRHVARATAHMINPPIVTSRANVSAAARMERSSVDIVSSWAARRIAATLVG